MRTIITGILFYTVLCITSAVIANADSLDINITSWHSNSKLKLNNNNYGVGYTHLIDNTFELSAGFYNNSYSKTSAYLMGGIFTNNKYVDFGVRAGFVSGYDDIEEISVSKKCKKRYQRYRCRTTKTTNVKNKSALVLAVIPTVRVKYKNHAMQFAYVPKMVKNGSHVITLQYQYNFPNL